MFVWGYLDGPREIFDDYSLEYVLNDKNVSPDFYMTYRDLNYDWNENGRIKAFEKNTVIGDSLAVMFLIVALR